MSWLLRCLCISLLPLTSCKRESVATPPVVEAYVWQSPERPEVVDAMVASRGVVKTLHVRAAEFRWTGSRFVIDRPVAEKLPEPGCGLVIRIGASASGLEWTPAQIEPVAQVVKELADLNPSEIQCDYDCPQKRLDRYPRLLNALQVSAGHVPVVPTTLASWLDEPAFKKVIERRPGYVLQVHSLQLPESPGQPVVLFDPAAARIAARKASALGVPFRIAMATYGCEVWFGADGRVVEVISEDSPPDGRSPASRAFALADPSASAQLVAEWNTSPPKGLQALVWYRLPIASDRRNWTWPTLKHVIQGENHLPRLAFEGIENEGVQDLFIVNQGEFPVRLPSSIIVRNPVIAADGGGPYRIQLQQGELRFVLRDGVWPWINPGRKIPSGWMRVREGGSRIDFTFTP
jgi:hypothetical protein